MKALTRSSAYTNPATTPRRNFSRANVSSICSIVRKGYRPLVPLGRIRTSVSVRYGFEKYAWRLRPSLGVAPAAISAVPAASAARWSSQAISGRTISTLMIRARARSISTSKLAVLIGIPWIPAAAKVCRIGYSGGQIGIRRGRVLCGRDAGKQEPCEGDRYQPPTHSVESPVVALRLTSQPPLGVVRDRGAQSWRRSQCRLAGRRRRLRLFYRVPVLWAIRRQQGGRRR